MLLLTAILLAIFVLPAPWNGLVLVFGVVGEASEMVFGIWYSRRRRSAGVGQMLGATVRVVEPCRPRGRVSYKGELWDADCAEGADIGERTRIVAVDGSRLVVERIAAA